MSAKKDIAVFVYPPCEAEGVFAGTLAYDRAMRSSVFTYNSRYLERPDALPVDPWSLPLDRNILPCVDNDGLYGAIRDGVPDFWGRLALEKRTGIPLEALHADELLLLSDASRAGNLDFRASPQEKEKDFVPPAVENLEELAEMARLMEENRPVPERFRALLSQGSSMGGARPKCMVESKDGLWLAKFPSKGDRWNNARVEWATLVTARHCGLNVCDAEIVEMGKKSVLLVRRFDRNKAKN